MKGLHFLFEVQGVRLLEVCRDWKGVDVACVQSETMGEMKMAVLAVSRDAGEGSPTERKSPVSLLGCSVAVPGC